MCVSWEDGRNARKTKLKHVNLSALHTTNHKIVKLTFFHGHSFIVFIPLLIYLFTCSLPQVTSQPVIHGAHAQGWPWGGGGGIGGGGSGGGRGREHFCCWVVLVSMGYCGDADIEVRGVGGGGGDW